MKNKTHIFLCVLAAVIFIGSCCLVNVLLGNPISHALAVSSAKQYIATRFPDSDYHLERVTYSFKDGYYHAFLTSPSNIDGDFSVAFTQLGKYKRDTYDSVTELWNTASRLEQEYRKLTDTVLLDPSLPYDNSSIRSIMFGQLIINPRWAVEDPAITDIPDYTLIQEDLILNHRYDIRELGAKAGHLVIYVDSEEQTPEEAARVLLDFKARFDAAEIPFYAIDLTLRPPASEDGSRDGDSLMLREFLYRDIGGEDLAQRVRTVIRETEKFYASLDK